MKSYKKLKSHFKPIVLLIAPKLYYRRLVKIAIKEMNVNSLCISTASSIPYNCIGKYPTMYNSPPAFYEKRKRSMLRDKDGIPMYIIDNKPVYDPTYIIQYGLSEYGFFVSTHDKSHFETARKIAEWLIDNQDVVSGYWYYSYNYTHKFTKFLLEAPWASAMAQGQAISLLTRMYKVTNEYKYISAAKKATKLFDVPIVSGGLASEMWGHTVYEEYPTIPYSLTLNGFMFCALGIYDLTQATDDKQVADLWSKAKDTLNFMVPLYDGDIMSAYCLSHVTVGNVQRDWADRYNSIHVTMLQCFESFIPSPTFKFYIKRWASFFGIVINK